MFLRISSASWNFRTSSHLAVIGFSPTRATAPRPGHHTLGVQPVGRVNETFFLRLPLLLSTFFFFLPWVERLPGGSDGKESAYNADLGSVSILGRSPGGEHGNPLQYSCLENPHGQRSLLGYSTWCRKKLDMTDWLSTAQCVYTVGIKEVSKELICVGYLLCFIVLCRNSHFSVIKNNETFIVVQRHYGIVQKIN